MVPTWLQANRCCLQSVHVTKILPWARKITRNATYVFQQDGCPAHNAKIVLEWLGSNMNFWPMDFWPPQSPDLNPLDYSVWTHIESKACKVRHSSVEELKSSVNRSWVSMRKYFIRKYYINSKIYRLHQSFQNLMTAKIFLWNSWQSMKYSIVILSQYPDINYDCNIGGHHSVVYISTEMLTYVISLF